MQRSINNTYLYCLSKDVYNKDDREEIITLLSIVESLKFSSLQNTTETIVLLQNSVNQVTADAKSDHLTRIFDSFKILFQQN